MAVTKIQGDIVFEIDKLRLLIIIASFILAIFLISLNSDVVNHFNKSK